MRLTPRIREGQCRPHAENRGQDANRRSGELPPHCAMPREFLKIRKTHLAVALAQGVSVQSWARANEVPGSTASPWASDPEVCHLVESIRRRVSDRAIRGLSKRDTRAAGAILELAESAEPESVRLKALQTVLADPMINGKYAKLKERVAGIERQLRERPKTQVARASSVVTACDQCAVPRISFLEYMPASPGAGLGTASGKDGNF